MISTRSLVARLWLVLALALGSAAGAGAQDLLEPEKAFALTTRALDDRTVELTYRIAKGYYLYRERFDFKADGATLGAAALPPGKRKKDEFFGDVETYRGELRFTLPVAEAASGSFKLLATSQGCADVGVCYPPHVHEVGIKLAAAGASTVQSREPLFGGRAGGTLAAGEPGQAAPASDREAAIDASNDEARFAGVLSQGGFWTVVGAFLLGGLALTFTPCVLPMVPILSGIIVGSGAAANRARGLALSAAYVLGVAVTYTAIGVAAALSGSLVSAALQNAWVLGAFALMFVILSLSMFGMYELRLPEAVSARLYDASRNLSGGRIGTVAAMGALSAVIVSPCVAAPLAGALLYISKSGDVALGATALFALALGMGLPLLLVGAFGGALLPKAGAWMETVKRFFGVLLLAVAIWVVSPVVPASVVMLLWAALAIGVAVFLRAIDSLPHEAPGYLRFGKAIGVISLVWGIALALGAASGGQDPLNPLAGMRASAPGGSVADAHAVKFERVASIGELEQRLARATQPVMLDFYADWCVSCKEMDRYTFADPRVRTQLAGMTLLQADVTANELEDKQLLKRFNLFGPPGIIFFDSKGEEIRGLRVIGYQNADRFLKTLELAQGR